MSTETKLILALCAGILTVFGLVSLLSGQLEPVLGALCVVSIILAVWLFAIQTSN